MLTPVFVFDLCRAQLASLQLHESEPPEVAFAFVRSRKLSVPACAWPDGMIEQARQLDGGQHSQALATCPFTAWRYDRCAKQS